MEAVCSNNSFANEDNTSSPVQTAQEQENRIYLHRSCGINEQGLCASHKSSKEFFKALFLLIWMLWGSNGFPEALRAPICLQLIVQSYVFLFPWLGLAQICLFEGEGAQVCLSGHTGWAESVWSVRQGIYICVSQWKKTPGAFTVAFYKAANPVPSLVMPPEAMIPLSDEQSPPVLRFSHFLIDSSQNTFLFPHHSPPGHPIWSHPVKFIPVFGSLPADQLLLQFVPPLLCSSLPAKEWNSPSLPRAADFVPAALTSGQVC